MAFISATQGIRDEIASRLNEVESDNTDQYTNWINLGLNDLWNSIPDADFLRASADRTLSSGTRIYTNQPSDFEKMLRIMDPAGDVELHHLTPEEFDMLQPSATEGGRPTVWTQRGWGLSANLEFYPQPAGSYTFHYEYQKVPNTVSLASARPELPTKWFETLVLYGEKMGWRRKGMFEQARIVDEEYQLLKEKMIQDMSRKVTQPTRIKNIREFGQRPKFDDPVKNMYWGQPL